MAVADHSGHFAAQPRPGAVRVRQLSAITILITAAGKIDANNAAEICGHIERYSVGYRQLVLDFSGVDFFSPAGYGLLYRVHSHCTRTAVDWVLVAGPEAQHLLRVCDPNAILPTAANIVSAVATLARSPHRIPQLRNGVR